MQSLQQAANCEFVAYLAFRWTDADLELVGVSRGDSAGQAKLEALTLLTAINSWKPTLTTAQGRRAIRGDALGVLYDVFRFRAKDAVLNDLVRAMALLVAPLGVDLRAAHIWSEQNNVCDLLSRLSLDGTSPFGTVDPLADPGMAALRGVPRTKPRRATTALLGRE